MTILSGIGRCALVLSACLPMASRDAVAADVPPLVLEATIPLANTGGRIDHMAVDLRRKRLFVAELGNGTMDVVDLAAGNITARIRGLNEPQGVGYSEPVGRIGLLAERHETKVICRRLQTLYPGCVPC